MVLSQSRINVFLNISTAGLCSDSQVLSFALVPEDDNMKDLYVELLDVDMSKIVYDTDKVLFNERLFNSVLEVDNESENIVCFKGHNVDIINRVDHYLRELSENNGGRTIRIWVDNPTAWFFFINTVFPTKGNTIQLSEYIYPDPIDINTFTLIFLHEHFDSLVDYVQEIPEGERTSIALAHLTKVTLSSIIENIRDNILKDEWY